MGFMDKMKTAIGLGDEEYYDEDELITNDYYDEPEEEEVVTSGFGKKEQSC